MKESERKKNKHFERLWKLLYRADLLRALRGKRTFFLWPHSAKKEKDLEKEKEIQGTRKRLSRLYGISYESYEGIVRKEEGKDGEAAMAQSADMDEDDESLKTISEIAKKSKYKREYLGYLIRQKKLKAKKVNGNWKTTLDWVKEFEREAEQRKDKMKKEMSERMGKEKKERGEKAEAEEYRAERVRINFQNVYVRAATALILLVFFVAAANITKADYEIWGRKIAGKVMENYNGGVEIAARESGKISKKISAVIERAKIKRESFDQIANSLAEKIRVKKFEEESGLRVSGPQKEAAGIAEQEGGLVAGETNQKGEPARNAMRSEAGRGIVLAETDTTVYADNIGDVEVSAYVLGSDNQEITNGDYQVRFSLYGVDRTESDPYPSDTDQGSRVWEETQTVVIQNGLLSTYLGRAAKIPESVDFGGKIYYLGVRIGEDSELAPRKRIGAVPLARVALNALTAQTLSGYTVGNASGNIPLSNGMLNTNLNSQFLEGMQAADFQPSGTYDNYVSWKLQSSLTDAGQQIKTKKGAIFTGANGIVTSRNLSTLTISPTYGSAASTIAQGNTPLVISTTGNLTGGGSGTSGGGISLTLNTIDQPTFTGLTVNGTANVTTLDFGTNTIADGNFTGDWNFNAGNLTGIASATVTGNFNLTASTNLIFGGTTSLGETTSPTDSGAYLVGANDEFVNSASTNVQAVLKDLDTAIAGGGPGAMWTLAGGTVYPTNATNDFAIGGTSPTSSIFGIDESAGNFYYGYDNSANPTFLFEATDADAGTFGFNTNDAFYFSGANVGIETVNPGTTLDVTGTGRFSSTLTASNGLTLTTGALNLTTTSGALTLSGLSASSINTGAADLTITSGNFNTTATGINSTAVGATTASTGAFTTLSSTGTTNLATAGASAVNIATTGTGNTAIGNATGTFQLTSNGGLNITTGGALTGVASIDTITTSSTALTFTSTAPTISVSTAATAIALDAGTTGEVNIAGTSTGNVNLAGGSGGTGCTVANATGDLACAGNITGSSSGTVGFWTRTTTNLTPATAGDDLYLPTNSLLGVGYDPATLSAGTVAAFNGNVGIGTTNPGSTLDIGQSVTAASAGTYYTAKLNNSYTGTMASATPVTSIYSLYNRPNIGIGGTSPQLTNLFVNYVSANVGVGTTTAVTNLYLNYIGAPTTNGGSSITNTYAFVSEAGAGSVGIGTTNPLQKLHVEGQCVTGDSLLPIVSEEGISNFEARISNQNTNDSISNEENIQNSDIQDSFKIQNSKFKNTRIDEIKGGEYVMSLDEKTGKLVPAKIKGLLDMGVKPIFKITTEDGRTIRTTGNHPYLARTTPNHSDAASEATGQAGNHPYLVKASELSGMVKEDDAEKNQQNDSHDDVRKKRIHRLVAPAVVNDDIADDDNDADYNISDEQIVVHDDLVSGKNLSASPKTATASNNPAEKVSRLKSLPANPGTKIATKVEPRSSLERSNKYSDIFSSWNLESFSIKDELSEDDYNKNGDSLSNAEWTPLDNQESNSREKEKYLTGWTKVAELSEGQEIAVPDENLSGVNFVKIARIELLPAEQVYDIEVEGTHNFTAGHYVNKKTGEALTEEEEQKLLSGERLPRGMERSDISYGGIIAHNTYINGSVGIGVSVPSYKLDIADSTTTRGLNIVNSTALSYGAYASGTKYGVYGSDGTTSGYLGYDDQYGLYTANNAYVGGSLTAGSISSGNITMANGSWIGLDAAKARMVFNDAARDNLTITDGDLLFSADNLWDIGATGATRPRTIYAGTSVIVGGTTTLTTDTLTGSGALNFTSQLALGQGTASAFNITSASDLGAADELLQIGDSTGTFLTVLGNGNVGIGTTSPLQKLHVEGQCVTGDSLLPIVSEEGISNFEARISNQNTNDSISNEENIQNSDIQDSFKIQNSKFKNTRIDEIKGGEYVMSLDEKTGKLVPARIKGLLDMGVQPIFKITTEDGRTIRTTGNHPYLTKEGPAEIPSEFNGAGWQKIANLREGDEIAVPKLFVPQGGIENDSQSEKDQSPNDVESGHRIEIKNHDVARLITLNEKIQKAKETANPEKIKPEFSSDPEKNGATIEAKNTKPTLDSVSATSFNWESESLISSEYNSGETDVKFVRIAKIEQLPSEQVYDIEVEGTHNFVANGIIAHNTYISGNVGIGVSVPSYRLDIADSTTTRGLNIVNSTALSYGLYSVGTKYGAYGSDGTTSGYLGYDDTYGLYTANNAYVGGSLTAGSISSGNITMGNGSWIGLDAAKARMVFNDAARDNLTITDGDLLFSADNLWDIGATGATRPRTIYAGTSVIVGGTTTLTTDTLTGSGALNLTSQLALGQGTSSAFNITSSNDLGIADELLQIGDSAGTFLTVLGNGNVGIGTTNPLALLSVGATSQFQVNSTGAIAAATGITSSGTITFSSIANDGAEATGILINGSNQLVWREFGSLAFSSSTIVSSLTGTTNEIDVSAATGDITLSLPNEVYLGTSGKIGREAENLFDFTADNQITARINNTDELTLTGSMLYPTTNLGLSLGDDTHRWADLYLGASTLHIGTDTTDEYAISYDTANNRLGFNVNGTGNPEFVMDANGYLGIGTTAPSVRLTVQGTNSETAAGSEMITNLVDRDFSGAGNWTGTGWSISGATWTHTAGANATTLANVNLSGPPVVGTTYLITFTINTTTAGTLTPSFGGVSGSALGQDVWQDITGYAFTVTATNTDPLTFTPNAAWAGYIDGISVKPFTSTNALAVLNNSDGTGGLEFRSGGTSYSNIFMGTDSGRNSYHVASNTGYYNVGFGYQTLYKNTTGYYNLAMGYQALYNNTVGSNNVAMGYQALYTSAVGQQNVAIGYATLYTNTIGTNNIAIGNQALNKNTTGANNIAIGALALSTSTTAGATVAVGYNALAVNTTGDSNTAIGSQSLVVNTTGGNNVAVGRGTLQSNTLTPGDYNTAIGTFALNKNTTGGYNTAVGGNAGYYSQTGTNNIFIGYQAAYGAATYTGADNNTIIGYQAGYSLATNSDGNVFLGYKAGYSETGSNKLYIANSDTTSLLYGDFSTGAVGIGGTAASTNPYLTILTGGNVGIGTTAPDSKLSVLGTATQLKLLYDASNYETFTVLSNGNLNIARNGAAATLALTDVGVGIGTTLPTQQLTVSANAIIGSSTSSAETLSNAGFSMGGDDLFVAGTAGIEGNVYTDGAFIAGASTTYGNGSITQTSGETLAIGTTSANLTLSTTTSGNLLLQSAGSVGIGGTAPSTNPYLTILAGGNVGIGTTNPLYKLQVNGTLDATTITQGGSPISGGDASYGSSASSPDNAVYVIDSGNVGIGTTSPTDKLDIAGGVKIGAGYAGIGTTAPVNGLLVQGNVGIGTSTPSGLFHVKVLPSTFSATGGTITTSGGYTIHTFTTSGTFTPNGAVNVEYLVVGGGGGGGGYYIGGGGGGGGMVSSAVAVTAQGYSVTAGEGGAGGATTVAGSQGSDSSFSTATAGGGGGGGGHSTCTAGNGLGAAGRATNGSGGGNSGYCTGAGGAGSGTGKSGGSGGLYGAAGGGGASAAGANGTADAGGAGGAGDVSSISGSSVAYSGGGGGAAYNTTGGAGGLGGGGAGADRLGAPTAGTANTGGGGGGASGYNGVNLTGAAGGSGIVIIRYLTGTGVATAVDSFVVNSAGNVGIGTTSPGAKLDVNGAIRGTSIENTGGTSGMSLSSSGYVSQYPPAQSDTYVKATTKFDTTYWPYFATDPAKSLTGAGINNTWVATNSNPNRFHIDLGSGKVITKVYYENFHGSGGVTDRGVKNFTLWGSNSAADFADLVYANNGTWTQLTTDVSQMVQHVALDQSDPKYIQVTNTVAYRYYAFKFADNWGELYMGVRRIELQTSSSNNVAFTTDSSERMRITSSGNVGIGTINPGAYKLHVEGAVIGTSWTTGDIFFKATDDGPDVWRMFEDTHSLYTQSLVTGQTVLTIKDNGNVGIGTTAPSSKLDISGSARIYDQTAVTGVSTLTIRAGAGQAASPYLRLAYDGSNYNDFYTTSAGNLNISRNGAAATLALTDVGVGIGTTAPTDKLDVAGGVKIGSGYAGIGTTAPVNGLLVQGSVGIGTSTPGYKLEVYTGSASGYVVTATGAWGNTSDARLKKNILSMDSALEKVMALNPVTYNTLGENDSDPAHMGFIAQEVEKISPDLVSTGPNGYKGISYALFTPLLAKAIQEQQSLITQNTQHITQLDLNITDVAQSTEELQTAVNDKLNIISNSLAALNSAAAKNTSDISALQSKTASLEQNMADMGRNITELTATLETMNETDALMISRITNHEARIAALEAGMLAGSSGTPGSFDLSPALKKFDSALASALDANGNPVFTLNGEFHAKVLGAESLKLGNQTSGSAKITAGQTEIAIPATEAKADSKIHITPTGSTFEKILYVKKEDIVPGESFKVKFDGEPVDVDITFNWLVVN